MSWSCHGETMATEPKILQKSYICYLVSLFSVYLEMEIYFNIALHELIIILS